LTTIQTYVKKIREQFYQGFPEKPIIIVGTKADLAIQQEINEIELSKEAEKLGCKCFITSAKTGKGIEQMFSNLVKSIMQAKEKFEEVEKAAESRNNPLNDSSSRSWCLLS
jgi:GTPase SAR1 family protein